ncbi:MAG: TrkA family potassium uptake protein [Cellulosilyticaceae bacterium]
MMFVIIVGCGRIGSMLASDLSKEGHNVTVIDRSGENLDKLGSDFNGVVIEGLGIDEEVLLKAGIRDADAFLAVSQEDNINIMAAQIAKNIFHVPKVIARNYKPELNDFYIKLGLDTVYPSIGTVEILKNKIFFDGVEVLNQLAEEDLIFIKIKARSNLDNVKIEKLEDEYSIKVLQIKKGIQKEHANRNVIIEEDDELIIAIKKEDVQEFNRLYGVKQ